MSPIQLFETNNLRFVWIRFVHGKVTNSKLSQEAKLDCEKDMDMAMFLHGAR